MIKIVTITFVAAISNLVNNTVSGEFIEEKLQEAFGSEATVQQVLGSSICELNSTQVAVTVLMEADLA